MPHMPHSPRTSNASLGLSPSSKDMALNLGYGVTIVKLCEAGRQGFHPHTCQFNMCILGSILQHLMLLACLATLSDLQSHALALIL